MKDIILDFRTEVENTVYKNKIYAFLNLLEDEYPDFDKWFFEKVFTKNSDFLLDRKILLKEHNNEICAISIMKPSEKKICTFRVAEDYQYLGIGTELLKTSMNILGEQKPLITVSEKRINEFHSLFKKFDFKLYSLYNDYYLKNVIEYSYNRDIEDSNSEILINI